MLPTRWSHLARHGLLAPTLLGIAAAPAAARPCDDLADRTITVVVGIEVSPKPRLIGGIEGRQCLSDNTEALVRLELGGGMRLIGGVRARPFESGDYDDGAADHAGVEAGALVDLNSRLSLHLAATYGSHSAYVALQGHIPVTEGNAPPRYAVLGGLAPWTLAEGQVVEGRPLVVDGRVWTPGVVRLPTARSGEARAVRDHFVASARFEYSSVWTFLRLAEELAAVGAPASLIAAALDAADDEVRHAEACAAAAGGLELRPLPTAAARRRFDVRSTQALATLAAEAWCEGCLNEGAAAEEARLAADDAQGAAGPMLAAIARDEAGHAELSWAVLAWVRSVAPDVARTTLASLPPIAPPVVVAADPALARHGVPRADVTQAAWAHATRTARARVASLAA